MGMHKSLDLKGHQFGRLLVLEEMEQIGIQRRWLCLCACGNTPTVRQASLRSGHTVSCGCFGREQRVKSTTKHGKARSPEHHTWTSMLQRCLNPKACGYADYGGRGITVCDRWRGEEGFAHFFEDLGPRPSLAHSLDRIDNQGSYVPGNCRWATERVQKSNTRRTHLLSFEGLTLSLTEWARRFSITPKTLRARIVDYGWTTERALTTSIGKHVKRG